MKLALLFLHLAPLGIIAMARMHLSKRLHREEEDQFEMRDAPDDRFPVQRGHESFPRCHVFVPWLLKPFEWQMDTSQSSGNPQSSGFVIRGNVLPWGAGNAANPMSFSFATVMKCL